MSCPFGFTSATSLQQQQGSDIDIEAMSSSTLMPRHRLTTSLSSDLLTDLAQTASRSSSGASAYPRPLQLAASFSNVMEATTAVTAVLTSSGGHDRAAPRIVPQWEMSRPVLDHCPKLKRRELRVLDKAWTLQEVREHRYKDDAWIAVDGKVYDITEHIVDHPGWDTGCGVSTILSILAHAGSECTQEFHDIHRSYPVAYKQLRAYYIGELAAS